MSLGGYNMSTKKKIEKELEKENIIKEIKKAQTDVAVAEKFFQFVSDPELVDVAIYNLEAKKSRYRYLIKIAKGDDILYIVFGNEIIDSSEIKDIIENNSDFNVEKDLTKGSKREDTLAYQISIDVALLNEVIKESYELDSIDEEELFDEYMTLSDELAMELEEYMPEDIIINARAYKWDNSDNTIKLVLAMAHLELGELKLSDITRRLLTQVD